MLPLRWVKPRPKKKPGESLVDYAGPKLEEFAVTGPPTPSPNPFIRLDREMEKRGWTGGLDFGKAGYTKGNEKAWINQAHEGESWFAYHSDGAESKPADTPDLVVEELLKMVDSEAYRRELKEYWAKLRAPKPPTPPPPTVVPFDARLEAEMNKRGWHKAPSFGKYNFGKGSESAWISQFETGYSKGKWRAHHNSGGSGSMTIGGPIFEDPNEAVDDLLRIVSDKKYQDQLEEIEAGKQGEEEKGPVRPVQQESVVPEENVEEEEHGDPLDGFRAGMGYYEDAFNKATNGEFYGDFAGVGFSVTKITEFEKLLGRYPDAAPALAAGFANLKAFEELEGAPNPETVKLIYNVEKLLAEYGVSLPAAAEPVKGWPWAELVSEAEALGWYREKGIGSPEGVFLREKASEQRAVSIAREATGLWIAYGETGSFTSVNAKKVGDWLLQDIKSLKVFHPGDVVGYAGIWWNHNLYRLVSQVTHVGGAPEPGLWNVENLERMPKHEPVKILNERDMVKIVGYKTPEQEEAEKLVKLRAWQKKYGMKEPELRAYLAELKTKHVPEEYLKKVEASYGKEDPIKEISTHAFIIRNLKEVGVKELKAWPQFIMENGEEVNVNFLKGHTAGIAVGTSNEYLRSINTEEHGEENPQAEENLKAAVITEDRPQEGVRAGYNAELPDGTLLRVTPPGQQTVEQLVKAGDLVYDSFEKKKHLVVRVHKYLQYGLPVYSLGVVDEGEKPTGKGGAYKSHQLGSLNELVAQDGVIRAFFQENDDTFTVVGPSGVNVPSQLEESEEEKLEEEGGLGEETGEGEE